MPALRLPSSNETVNGGAASIENVDDTTRLLLFSMATTAPAADAGAAAKREQIISEFR